MNFCRLEPQGLPLRISVLCTRLEKERQRLQTPVCGRAGVGCDMRVNVGVCIDGCVFHGTISLVLRTLPPVLALCPVFLPLGWLEQYGGLWHGIGCGCGHDGKQKWVEVKEHGLNRAGSGRAERETEAEGK